jgi:triosephosphate isomerase
VQDSRGSAIQVAAQNCYSQNEGAYTGEISPKFLKDMGVSHVILGHSERRHIFGESDEMIRDKVAAALEVGLVPIFCIGETLEEREGDQVEQVLERQVGRGLKDLRFGPEDLIVAYEPVWAIGTGKVAQSSDAQQAHAFVRSLLHQRFGPDIGEGVRILYGGSVKPDNIADLMAQPDIDGGLIGGASLKKDSFVSLVQSIGA